VRTFYSLVLGTALMAGPQAAPKPKTKQTVSSPAKVASEPVKVTSVEGITEYRLGNGLRVLLFPDASKPATTVNVTYLVGSRNENYGETGMAHLLEHLVFKPSKNFSGKDGKPTPVQVLNKLGARFNGTTSEDRTNYFVTFPAGEENLKLILDLEADRMVNANIDQKDLWDPEAKKGEMTVVRNEMEGGENDPLGITLERTTSAAYEWHNYGKSTIGARSDVENVNIDHLRAFYHNYYQPDNAVLLVAGKFDEAKTLAMINERFGRLPKPARVIQPTYTLDPTQDGERAVTVRRVGDVQALVAAYKIPAGPDMDTIALEVLSRVMTTAPSGRLHKALVDTKKAGFVFGMSGGSKEPGLAIYATQIPKDGNLEEAKSIFLDTLEKTADQPITQEEVERAKQEILKQIELSLNDSDRVGVSLSNYISQGDWRLFFLHRDRIRKITSVQVRAAASKYLKRENRTLGQFIPTATPDRAEIPAMQDAVAMVADYKGAERIAQGEAFDASPANIDSRTRKATIGNLKAAFLPKKTRGESVTFTMALHFGTEASLQGKDSAGSLAAAMLMRGTTAHTRQQLKDELDKLKANLSVTGDAEGARANITTTRANLPAVVALLAEVLKTPAFDGEELARLVNESVTSLESQKAEPAFQAQQTLRRHLNPYAAGHPRYVGTLEEDLAQLKSAKAEDLKAFHKAFYGATGELAVIGDFDDKALEAQIKELFGSWKAQQAYERIPSRLKDVAPINAKLETPDKAQAIFLATEPMAVKDSDPDYPALLLGNYLLGGGAINSRIANRLRQKEGLSYGAGSNLQAGALDAVGAWIAFAIYAPENLGRLQSAFQEELKLALDKGFTAEEIQAAKTSWLQSQASSRAQDRELASRLSSNLFNGRSMAFQSDLEKKVQALGSDEILAALKKRLDPSKLNMVAAGDFAKSDKTAAGAK
jgi:zinc protease